MLMLQEPQLLENVLGRCLAALGQLEPRSHVHGFPHRQQWLVQVFLGYVAGGPLEFLLVSGLTVYEELAGDARLAGEWKKLVFTLLT